MNCPGGDKTCGEKMVIDDDFNEIHLFRGDWEHWICKKCGKEIDSK